MPDEILINPDCAAGKHLNCNDDGWDAVSDEPTGCPCHCHNSDRETGR